VHPIISERLPDAAATRPNGGEYADAGADFAAPPMSGERSLGLKSDAARVRQEKPVRPRLLL
jgi:hypothetical protein